MNSSVKIETVKSQRYMQFFMFSLIVLFGLFVCDPAEAAGWGTKFVNKIDEVNGELKIVGGGIIVLALIWLALSTMLKIERDFRGTAVIIVGAGMLMVFAKDIAEMIVNMA